MTKTITADEAIALMQRAVDAEGAEHRVDNCVYFAQTAEGVTVGPSCLVGYAFSYVGVEVDDLLCEVNLNPNGVEVDCLEVRGIELSLGAQRAFKAAQEKQDSYRPWGEALDAAKEAVSK